MSQVNKIIPYLAGILAMHGNVMAAEGILLGRRDLKFLGFMYGLYFAVVPVIMFRLKNAIITGGQNFGLRAIWRIFLGYQGSRMTLWVGRALWLTRKKSNESSTSLEKGIPHNSAHASEETIAQLSSDFSDVLMSRNETGEMMPCLSA